MVALFLFVVVTIPQMAILLFICFRLQMWTTKLVFGVDHQSPPIKTKKRSVSGQVLSCLSDANLLCCSKHIKTSVSLSFSPTQSNNYLFY